MSAIETDPRDTVLTPTDPSVPASTHSVVDTYRRRARHYDLTANLYYLIGFREMAHRASRCGPLWATGPGHR